MPAKKKRVARKGNAQDQTLDLKAVARDLENGEGTDTYFQLASRPPPAAHAGLNLSDREKPYYDTIQAGELGGDKGCLFHRLVQKNLSAHALDSLAVIKQRARDSPVAKGRRQVPRSRSSSGQSATPLRSGSPSRDKAKTRRPKSAGIRNYDSRWGSPQQVILAPENPPPGAYAAPVPAFRVSNLRNAKPPRPKSANPNRDQSNPALGPGTYDSASAMDKTKLLASKGILIAKEHTTVNLLRAIEETKDGITGKYGQAYDTSLERRTTEDNWTRGFTIGKPPQLMQPTFNMASAKQFDRSYDPLSNTWTQTVSQAVVSSPTPPDSEQSKVTSFTDADRGRTIGVKFLGAFETSAFAVATPAPGEHVRHKRVGFVPGGTMSTSPRFSRNGIYALPGCASSIGQPPPPKIAFKPSEKNFLEINSNSTTLSPDAKLRAHATNMQRTREREAAVKAKKDLLAQQAYEQQQKAIALDQIPIAEMRAGRRWGVLHVLALASMRGGPMAAAMVAHRQAKRTAKAMEAIQRFALDWRLKRRLRMIKAKYPSLKTRITKAVRCYLAKAHERSKERAAIVVKTFLKESQGRGETFLAMKRFVRKIIKLQHWWRKLTMMQDAKQYVLKVKWRRLEDSVLIQARIERDRKLGKIKLDIEAEQRGDKPRGVKSDEVLELEAALRDPWFPNAIPRRTRQQAIKESLRDLYYKVYLPGEAQQEELKRQWLIDEKARCALEMARMLIHSQGDAWRDQFSDDALLKRCPHNWRPFLVHNVSDEDMARMITRAVQVLLQERRAEQLREIEEDNCKDR